MTSQRVLGDLLVTATSLERLREFRAHGLTVLESRRRYQSHEHLLMAMFHPTLRILVVEWTNWHMRLYDEISPLIGDDHVEVEAGMICTATDGRLISAQTGTGHEYDDYTEFSSTSMGLIDRALGHLSLSDDK